MAAFITPVEVTPGSSSAWTDVDVSSLGVPSGATGVILHYENISGSTAYAVGWRNNGSTDARIQTLALSAHAWVAVGVDASRIFEAYVGHTTNTNIYLVGYFTTDAVFFTNGVDKSIGTTTTWTDVDISGDTGGDTAIGAIVEVISAGTLRAHGLRKNGSTDNRITTTQNHHAGVWIIGVDGSEIFEAYIANVEQDHFLLGYIKSDWTFLTNATDLSTGTTGSYVDLTALPAGALGGLIEVSNSATAEAYALRKNGSSEDIYRNARNHPFAIVEADGSQLVEGKIASTTMDFWLVGYPTAVGGSTYTLTAAQGSFTETGQAANLLAGRKVSANSGSYSETGQAATLKHGHLLSSASGSFIETGIAAELRTARRVAGDVGSFALVGQSAGLLTSRIITSETGSFSLTGQAASLLRGYPLTASVGSFALTGNDAGLRAARTLNSDVGSFVLSGQAVTFNKGFSLTANVGSFNLSGQTAGLLTNRILAANNGAFNLTGNAATLTKSSALTLTASSGSFALAGQSANLLVSHLLTANNGTFNLTGNAADLVKTSALTLSASTGTFSLTGQAAGLRITRLLSSNAGSFSLTGTSAGLLAGHVLSSNAGSYLLTGNAANVRVGRTISASVGTFTVTGQTAELKRTRILSVGAGAFVLTGMDALLVSSALDLNTYSATISVVAKPSALISIVTKPGAGIVVVGEQ